MGQVPFGVKHVYPVLDDDFEQDNRDWLMAVVMSCRDDLTRAARREEEAADYRAETQ